MTPSSLLLWTVPAAALGALVAALLAAPRPDASGAAPGERVVRGVPITMRAGFASGSALDAEQPGEAAAVTLPGPGEEVDFARFAFVAYDPPDLRGPDAAALTATDFPEAVGVLDGRELAVAGYPQATLFDAGEVHELLLSRFPPGCCFGTQPVLDEWIHVELAEPLAIAELGEHVLVGGRLEVGERIDETGFVLHLYRLREARAEAR